MEMELKHVVFNMLMICLTNSKSEITYKNLPMDDPKKRKPNIQLAKKFLNWEPKVDLNRGLLKTILYFQNYI